MTALHKIIEQEKLLGSASKATKDFQILLFDVHDVHKTLKVSFTRRIGEGDGEQVISSIKAIVFSCSRSPLPSSDLRVPNRAFSPDIMAAMLAYSQQNNLILYFISGTNMAAAPIVFVSPGIV